MIPMHPIQRPPASLGCTGCSTTCRRAPPGCPKPVGAALPPGTQVGFNDWKRADFGGPCPPIGRHRYFHKLYALDTQLNLAKPATKPDVEAAMRGHVLAEAQIIGTYQKQKAK